VLPPNQMTKLDRCGVGARLPNRAQKTAGSRKLAKRPSSWRGLPLDSLLPRGNSQDMFPEPSLCTTANSRCQPFYLLAKIGVAVEKLTPRKMLRKLCARKAHKRRLRLGYRTHSLITVTNLRRMVGVKLCGEGRTAEFFTHRPRVALTPMLSTGHCIPTSPFVDRETRH
jgi:hypothetical protein